MGSRRQAAAQGAADEQQRVSRVVFFSGTESEVGSRDW